jgi:DNA-binding MarR family transcriptional regulator
VSWSNSKPTIDRLYKADLCNELVDRRRVPTTRQEDLLSLSERGCFADEEIINADALDAEILLRARKVRGDRENLSLFRQYSR